MSQPSARIDTVYETYFGTMIADPYRWMEDMESDEFQSWIMGQGADTRAVLDAVPEHARRTRNSHPRGYRVLPLRVLVWKLNEWPRSASASLPVRCASGDPL